MTARVRQMIRDQKLVRAKSVLAGVESVSALKTESRRDSVEDRSRHWQRDLIDCRSTDYPPHTMCRLGRILRNVVGFTGFFVVGFDNKIVTFSRTCC